MENTGITITASHVIIEMAVVFLDELRHAGAFAKLLNLIQELVFSP